MLGFEAFTHAEDELLFGQEGLASRLVVLSSPVAELVKRPFRQLHIINNLLILLLPKLIFIPIPQKLRTRIKLRYQFLIVPDIGVAAIELIGDRIENPISKVELLTLQ